MTNPLKDQVWSKGKTISGHSSDMWRKDQCGAWIKYNEYGNRSSEFGWEIDHISLGGETILSNLRPLQWRNNLSKNNGKLVCSISAKPYLGSYLNSEDR